MASHVGLDCFDMSTQPVHRVLLNSHKIYTSA